MNPVFIVSRSKKVSSCLPYLEQIVLRRSARQWKLMQRFYKEANIQWFNGGAIEYTFLKLAKDFFPESKLALPGWKEEEE
jgi:hypothetical protein